MKIIFLDIDGVLNTIETFKQRKINWLKTGIYELEIDEFRIGILKKIIDKTDAKIVLSSSWRIMFKKENDEIIATDDKSIDLINLLKKYNIKIFDITPKSSDRLRKNEIIEWLNKHDKEVESFIIFDDDSLDLDIFVDKELIKTSFAPKDINDKNIEETCGLCYRHIEPAIKILNKKRLIK